MTFGFRPIAAQNASQDSDGTHRHGVFGSLSMAMSTRSLISMPHRAPRSSVRLHFSRTALPPTRIAREQAPPCAARSFRSFIGAMNVELAEERVLVLPDPSSMEGAQTRAWG